MVHLVKALLGGAYSPGEVFAQFRSMYEADTSDREIWQVIRWGQSKNPTPYRAWQKGSPPMNYYSARCPSAAEIVKKTSIAQAIANARDYLDGFEITEADLHDASVIPLPSDFPEDTALVFSSLYEADEFVCVNSTYRIDRNVAGSEKATPVGAGVTHTVQQWGELIKSRKERPTPAGVWIRMNPVTETGSGKAGAHTDDDVTDYRFVLIEFDSIPLEIQLSLLCSLYWPVAMICSSGGKSYHAWILSGCTDRESYDRKTESIYRELAKFKVDPSNANPSRYSRLPGVKREIGAVGSGEQKIIYLNPKASLEHPIL
ncbi:MAG TPA: hypothetical protein VHS80_08675 [Chthoniobacterales bacterium]|jgi:hypothetical protein|nr:hypothetical protein [Chthoniobacterales bacterium]